jgi:hypothetical protein
MLLVSLLPLGVAEAAPPASCASKFIGTWTVRVNATGQTYPLIIRPDGTSRITCPLCPSEGTWTCTGHTFMSIAPVATTSTLSADGRTLTGSCCTTTRVSSPAMADRPAARGVDGQPSAGGSKTVSCDLIRPTAAAGKACDDADFALHAARAARADYPRVAAEQYKQAAAAARRAGDTKLELTILREATGSRSP